MRSLILALALGFIIASGAIAGDLTQLVDLTVTGGYNLSTFYVFNGTVGLAAPAQAGTLNTADPSSPTGTVPITRLASQELQSPIGGVPSMPAISRPESSTRRLSIRRPRSNGVPAPACLRSRSAYWIWSKRRSGTPPFSRKT